jgi:transcriptional regulator with XRE-family HTH domain
MDRRYADHRGTCCAFGKELRKWRHIRAMSQLDLAIASGTSPRHLSFVETGRASPGHELVLRLAGVLDIPLRARNDLLVAAGFAPSFRDSELSAPAMENVRRAVAHILTKQEPYPAIVARPDWTVIMANDAATRWRRLFVSDAEKERLGPGAANAMKAFFDPRLLRPYVVNWDVCAREILLRLRYESAGLGPDAPGARLIRELMAYPDVPQDLEEDEHGLPPNEPLMTVHMAKNDIRLSYFSMLTTFGTPHDALLEELRIKLFFPADADSAALFHRLAASQVVKARELA